MKPGLCGTTLLKSKWQQRMMAGSGSDMRTKEESREEQVQGMWRRKTPVAGSSFYHYISCLSHNREMDSVEKVHGCALQGHSPHPHI